MDSSSSIVRGRVDAAGRLVEADARLAALQVEAGSSLGARVALPTIAEVVRLSRDLGVPLARPVTLAGASEDFDVWVRTSLDGDEVALEIEGWRSKSPGVARLGPGSAESEGPAPGNPTENFWATDADLRLTLIGRSLAERMDVDPGDALGEPLTRYFRLVEDEDGSMPLLAGLAALAPFAGQQAVARSGDGEAFTLAGEALTDETGKFSGFSGQAVPASGDLNAAENELEDKGLIGGIKDALRTPIDRIIAAADKIVERGDGPLRSDYASYATDIAAAGRHLMAVVRTMSEGVTDVVPVELRACVAESITIVSASAAARQIDIRVKRGPSILVRGDSRGIVQILVNILTNAIRHSPMGGVVTAEPSSDEGRARIAISDNGPGIAPKDQIRIFERFERVGDKPDGTGLGLPIARRIAGSMDGSLMLDTAYMDGARFTLELPAA